MSGLQILNAYSRKYESVKLSSILKARIFGIAKLGPRKYLGWRRATDFYLYKCNGCGKLHIDYKQGYDRASTCPFENVVALSNISSPVESPVPSRQ